MPKKILSSKKEFKEESIIKDEEKNPLDEEKNPLNEGIESQVERSLEDFGQQIRDTRITNNLSLESVSGHLHISVKILEAIEEGKPEKGPTPVFFRGLVRTYCQFLELDKTEFIDKIDKKLREFGEEEKISVKTLKPVFSVSDSFPIRNILTMVGIIIGCSLIYYSFFTATIVDKATDKITNLNLENDKTLTEIKIKEKTLKKSQDKIYKKEKKPKKSQIKENISFIEKQEKRIESPVTKKVNYEPLTIEVEASRGTWISLAIDDLDTQDYRIGTDEIKQWIANNKFVLTIGNTKVVRVLLNGREIETNRDHDLLSNWLIDSNFLP